MDATQTIQKLAEQQATKGFTEAYIQSSPQEEREDRGLGAALAAWAGWDGLKLMRVFHAALEEANFHDEAAQVQAMIDREERQ